MTTTSELLLPAEIVTTMQDDASARIEMRGEFDFAVSPALSEVLLAHLEAGRGHLHIDAGGVTFADASAVGVLAHAVGRCRNAGGALVLSVTSAPLSRILMLTGVDAVLPVAPG